MKIHILWFALFGIHHLSVSQNQTKADSLQIVLKGTLPDTVRANMLFQLSEAQWTSNMALANDAALQCKILSEQIGFKRGVTNGLNALGVIAHNKGDYLEAMRICKEAIQRAEENRYTVGLAFAYSTISSCFIALGNFQEAFSNAFHTLRISESAGDKKGIANAYINIGLIYNIQGDFTQALKYYHSSLIIQKEIGDKYGMAKCYVNLGFLYDQHGDLENAMKNYYEYLSISQEIGDKQGVAGAYLQIGPVLNLQGHHDNAVEMGFDALDISHALKNDDLEAAAFYNIGKAYFTAGKYEKASFYLEKSIELSRESGSLVGLQDNYFAMAVLDSAQGDFRQAFNHYKLFIDVRDSLFNKENTKKLVQTQMQYNFDKKEALTKAEQDKELEKQKLLRNGFVGGMFLFLMLAGAIFIGLVKTGKEKKKSEELLLNILPAEVAEELKVTGSAKAKAYTMVTVMLTDFVDFTSVSEKVSAELLVDEIHTCFSAFDNIIHKYKIEKIKTIGDAYLCASGLPVSNYTHAKDMIMAAIEIRDYMLQRKIEKEARGEIPFELRIGIHTGPVVAGIVGVKKYAYDIWGDTVNVSARMEQNSEAGKINISGSTYELVKEKFACIHRGKIQAKHKGEIDMYFVEAI